MKSSRCTVCNHHLVNDIDLAILSGDYSLNALSREFGPSRSAFQRHKGHLEKKLRHTVERLENYQKQASLLKLSGLLDHVEKRVEAAAAAEDTDRVFKGAHVGSRLIHQINKMDVHLELDTVYRLLSSPSFTSRDSLLPAGPHIITDLHQTLVDQISMPCPDEDADESRPADQPGLEQELQQLLDSLKSKKLRRRTVKAAHKEQHLRRHKQRQQKHLFQEKNLALNFAPEPDSDTLDTTTPPETWNSEPETALPETCSDTAVALAVVTQSAAPPATLKNSAPLETRNSKLETALSNPSSLIPDPCLSTPQPQRDKSGTIAKQQRRRLRKMVQNLKHSFKTKKLLQKFTGGQESETPPATLESLTDTSNPSAPLETRNPEPETPTDPCLSDPWPLTADPCLSDPRPLTPDPCLSESENQEPPTENLPLADPRLLERTADELFEISHGYKRGHPPRPIPNRRRDEDFRSRTVFGDVKNILKYM